ncbi:hypothetical protein ACTXMZ_10245 [Brachybacterium alimentarium]|uniref:hypothetical protein n=1 Tax=Brachybacterium alimentarium TaxID=47845 RepID=UPI003FD48E2E
MTTNHSQRKVTMPHQNTPRRDPFGIVLASAFLVVSAALTATALCVGGWALLLLVPAAPALLFGLGGLALDAVKRPRDHAGRVVR